VGEVPIEGASPIKSREIIIILRKLLFIPVVLALTLFSVSCDSNNDAPSSTETQAAHSSAHQAPPEVEAKILADTTEDLKIIAGTGADTSQLATALTGKALEETKAQIGKDLAEGKIRKRDYQNLNVLAGDYTAPVAEVLAEFDDMGYYVDANTGASLASPTNEHKSYALAVVEEGGRWKIKLILSPSATTTTPTEGQTGQ
jgi:hypothetical protein